MNYSKGYQGHKGGKRYNGGNDGYNNDSKPSYSNGGSKPTYGGFRSDNFESCNAKPSYNDYKNQPRAAPRPGTQNGGYGGPSFQNDDRS